MICLVPRIQKKFRKFFNIVKTECFTNVHLRMFLQSPGLTKLSTFE